MANLLESSKPKLADIEDALDQSPLICYVLDTSRRVVYCNLAWDRFAIDNAAPDLAGAGALGADINRVIGEDLRPFYRRAFEQATQSETVWECLYECSSPQLFRKFRMRIHPLAPAGWHLITNARVIERPHHRPVTVGLEDYVNSNAQITVCSHCRCSRRAVPPEPEQWDFVPTHLERHMGNVSHGLCRVCLDYFYPEPHDSYLR
jgi:hypothetical protein